MSTTLYENKNPIMAFHELLRGGLIASFYFGWNVKIVIVDYPKGMALTYNGGVSCLMRHDTDFFTNVLTC